MSVVSQNTVNESPKLCSATIQGEPCNQPVRASGLCKIHYDRHLHGRDMDAPGRVRSPERVCSVEGCDRPVKSRGWCSLHYTRWRRHGTVDLEEGQPEQCAVEGCDRFARSRGWCDLHYGRWYKYGDTGPAESTRPVRHEGPCAVEGCGRRRINENDGCGPYTRRRGGRWRDPRSRYESRTDAVGVPDHPCGCPRRVVHRYSHRTQATRRFYDVAR
jgi:hypothetical protein